MQETEETWVRSLVWEDPPEWGTATHSSILAWRIVWTEEPGGLQIGLQIKRPKTSISGLLKPFSKTYPQGKSCV